MMKLVDVAVVGAGPYGLSIAAHLRSCGLEIRVFGIPMETWQEAMPAGMKLKSEGFATSLSAPRGKMTLGAYCAEHGLRYADIGIPVALDQFVAYGKAFQQRFVPDLVRQMVVSIEPASHGFNLRTEDGSDTAARRVVVAAGIRFFDYTPPELRELPAQYLSHSANCVDAAPLVGKEVIVVGAGASATDTAAFLHSRGINVTILTRRKAIRFQSPLGERSLWQKISGPMTGLGPGWKAVLCVKAPLLFHAMPESFRGYVVRRFLGPAPAWFVRESIEGHVPFILESQILGAEVNGNRAVLKLAGANGEKRSVSADHIVAATGYRVDVDRLPFLSADIRARLRLADRSPVLSRNFESSVDGLYFIGAAAANSFGPMLRFVYGADFASKQLARHLVSSRRRQSVSIATQARDTSAVASSAQ